MTTAIPPRDRDAMTELNDLVAQSANLFGAGSNIVPEGAADTGFIRVAFSDKPCTRDELRNAMVRALDNGRFGPESNMTSDEWIGGPSYIKIGAWCGDQTRALALMGLIQLVDLGKIITPATLGLDNDSPEAKQMMGVGFIMATADLS